MAVILYIITLLFTRSKKKLKIWRQKQSRHKTFCGGFGFVAHITNQKNLFCCFLLFLQNK